MVNLVRYWLRRYTSSEWAKNNPILGDGEVGLATDTQVFKIGDGVSHWDKLSDMSENAIALMNQMSAASAASRFLAKLKANKSDVNLVFLTDSTGSSYAVDSGWTEQIGIRLGDRFSEITVKQREWNGNVADVGGSEEWGSWETLHTGSGDHTLWVHKGVVGGTNTRYPLARMQAMVTDNNPDLIVIGHGANELYESATSTRDSIRSTYLCLTEALRRAVPNASLILCSQHVIPPEGSVVVADSVMMMENIALVAMLTGAGFVNETLPFLEIYDDITEYLIEDLVHCNQKGHDLWAETFWNQAFSIEAAPVNHQRPSSFVMPIARSLLSNGLFTSFVPPAAPTGWAGSNVTMEKDTVNTTGENGNGWALKMTSLDTGISVLQQSVNAYILALYKGEYVTLCACSRLESPLPDFASGKGVVAVYDGINYSAGIPDMWSDDEFVYHAITHKVHLSATQIRADLMCESAPAVAGTITQYEWATLVPGPIPSAPMGYDHAAAMYDHLIDTLNAHAASAIGFTPAAGIIGINVAAALAEIAPRKEHFVYCSGPRVAGASSTPYVYYGPGSVGSYGSDGIGQYMTFRGDITPGTYNFRFWYLKLYNMGIVTVALSFDEGGTWTDVITGLDLYAAAAEYYKYIDVADIVVPDGKRTVLMRVTATGKNASSSNYLPFAGCGQFTS